MPFVHVNGIDLHYTIDGTQGPWICLSHSLACNLSAWDAQVDLLKNKFRVLRFDTRGHGKSSAPPGPYTLDQLANDVHGLFLHLKIDQAHWMGISMGGMIGQTYALKNPNFFLSLILADSTSRRPPDAEKMWGQRIEVARTEGMKGLLESTLTRWFTEDFRKNNPTAVSRIGLGILNTPSEGFIGCCEAISKIDLLERLHEIKCATLILVGEHDHGTPPEMSRQMHDNIKKSQLFIIPNAAHISNIEQEQVFNSMIEKFLNENSRSEF